MKPIITIKYCLLLMLLGIIIPVAADGGLSLGDEFRSQSTEYAAKAYLARNKGDEQVASLYMRMSNIKKYTAELADRGHWLGLDWALFYANARRISAGEDVEKLISELTPLSSQFESSIAAK